MEILLTVQIIVVVALIVVILVQRSDSDGFTGNSSSNSFMTGRAQANLFTKTTAILATIFIVNSLVLGYMAAHTERTSDLIDKVISETEENAKEVQVEVDGEVDSVSEKLEDLADEVQEKAEDIKKEITPVEAPAE